MSKKSKKYKKETHQILAIEDLREKVWKDKIFIQSQNYLYKIKSLKINLSIMCLEKKTFTKILKLSTQIQLEIHFSQFLFNL